METSSKKKNINTSHRFLDEAGDSTFFGKGKNLILGANGVSLSFSIGMVEINGDLKNIREKVVELQKQVEEDEYLKNIPSIQKKINNKGFFFHATDDPPEVRQLFYKFIKELSCSLEMVVARKNPELFIKKHNGKEKEFYADILSHLIKNKLKKDNKLVLNIASKGNTTANKTLQMALEKALGRASKNHSLDELKTEVSFNVQNHYTEPLLNIADYLCWAVQRVFERGEIRYYDFIKDKISLVVDIYDYSKDEDKGNHYKEGNLLSAKNKLGPHLP